MNKARSKPSTTETTNGQPLVLFGLDEMAKPRAARFSSSQSELAAKAAELMGLHTHPVRTSEIADIAAKLPTGRVYANGRGFVPNVRRDLYAKFTDAIGHRDHPVETPPTSLPENWNDIAPGNLVIAQETLEYGWWEAVVVSRDGDMLTLRYRDYPKYPPFVCHYASVGLMNPIIP